MSNPPALPDPATVAAWTRQATGGRTPRPLTASAIEDPLRWLTALWTRLEGGAVLDPAITPTEAARLRSALYRMVDEVAAALQERATVEGGET